MSDLANTQVYVVLIWVKPDQLEVLHEYERLAEPIMRRHGGSFRTVMTVSADAMVPVDAFERSPDEVHVLEFSDATAFGRYREDPDSLAIGHLRDASVERVIFLQGESVALFT